MLSACYDLHKTDGNILGCGARSVIFTSIKMREAKVGVTVHAPVSFLRWREVLQAEIGDLSKRNGMEPDVLAWLKFLKASARRASVEYVSGLSTSYRRTGAKNRLGARIPAAVFKSVAISLISKYWRKKRQNGRQSRVPWGGLKKMLRRNID
jgi:hypothetical protein